MTSSTIYVGNKDIGSVRGLRVRIVERCVGRRAGDTVIRYEDVDRGVVLVAPEFVFNSLFAAA